MNKPEVRLHGNRGQIIWRTAQALNRAGRVDLAREFSSKITGAQSYDGIKEIAQEYCIIIEAEVK